MKLSPRRIAANDWIPMGVDQLELGALEVVRSTDHRSVIAGPGAGKTELLAQRAAYLLQTQRCESPQRILAISFKRDAARNLAERVAARCHPDHACRFDSMTFDAFAKSLVDRFGQALPAIWRPTTDYEIASLKQSDWESFLQSIRAQPDRFGSEDEVQKIPAKYFERDWVVGRPLPDDKPFIKSTGEWAAWTFWQQMLKTPSSLTFPMLGRLAELIFRVNPMTRTAMCLTYSHVFMDEFQDATQVQYDLMRTIFHGSSTVITAVGDNKQQIMRFAMAMKNPFKAFESDFSATRTPLVNNYRSSLELVRIQHVLAQALDANAVKPVSQQTQAISGDCCSVMDFPTVKTEADYIASLIAKQVKEQAVQPRDVCILVRQLADGYAKALAPSFATRGLKLRNESAYVVPNLMLQELLTEDLSHMVVQIIKLAACVDVAPAWTNALKSYLRLCGERDLRGVTHEKLSRELDEFTRVLFMQHADPPRIKDEAEALVASVINFLGRARITACFPSYAQGNWFKTVETGIVHHLLSCSINSKTWRDALSEYEGWDSVPLMTLHKSKGLEFHTVILIGLDDSAWWSYRYDVSEATSCFFVAFSRAKQRVVFTYCPLRGIRTLIAPFYRLLAKAGVTPFSPA